MGPFYKLCCFLLKWNSRIIIEKLQFRMTDIVDDKGESVRARITRRDLFEIQKQIVESDLFLSLTDKSWSGKTIYQYLKKSVMEGNIGGGIPDYRSANRALYIINVVYWYSNKLEIKLIK